MVGCSKVIAASSVVVGVSAVSVAIAGDDSSSSGHPETFDDFMKLGDGDVPVTFLVKNLAEDLFTKTFLDYRQKMMRYFLKFYKF